MQMPWLHLELHLKPLQVRLNVLHGKEMLCPQSLQVSAAEHMKQVPHEMTLPPLHAQMTHRQVDLALFAPREPLQNLTCLLHVLANGLHFVQAVLIILSAPPRLRPVYLLPRPAYTRAQILLPCHWIHL